MIKNIRSYFKKLFCRHEYERVYHHSYKCTKCGQLMFVG